MENKITTPTTQSIYDALYQDAYTADCNYNSGDQLNRHRVEALKDKILNSCVEEAQRVASEAINGFICN